ncbi:hypothetical protein INT45_013345 [Circinella minor]|uniref:Uncharacterized protein n=1 Tax=Circinella minor TaxID=1195481 RepID=A0A8H7VL68_9FUNG|nr:hypothetical protein INT45_013345 [Circinella minor]
MDKTNVENGQYSVLRTTPTTKLSLRESKRATSQWMVEAWNNEDDDLLVFGDILHQTQVFNHYILELELIQFIPVMVIPRLLSGTSSKTREDTFVLNAVSDLLNVVFGEDQRLVHECVEIKPPGRTSDDDVCEDRVKLGNQMKTMMQTLESLKIANAQTCGLLIQGYDCTL